MWLFILVGLVMPPLALGFVVPAYLLDPAPVLRRLTVTFALGAAVAWAIVAVWTAAWLAGGDASLDGGCGTSAAAQQRLYAGFLAAAAAIAVTEGAAGILTLRGRTGVAAYATLGGVALVVLDAWLILGLLGAGLC